MRLFWIINVSTNMPCFKELQSFCEILLIWVVLLQLPAIYKNIYSVYNCMLLKDTKLSTNCDSPIKSFLWEERYPNYQHIISDNGFRDWAQQSLVHHTNIFCCEKGYHFWIVSFIVKGNFQNSLWPNTVNK